MLKSKPRKRLKKPVTIDELYPELSPKQRKEARDNLRAYFEVIYRIHTELESEGTLDKVLQENRLRKAWEKRFSEKRTGA